LMQYHDCHEVVVILSRLWSTCNLYISLAAAVTDGRPCRECLWKPLAMFRMTLQYQPLTCVWYLQSRISPNMHNFFTTNGSNLYISKAGVCYPCMQHQLLLPSHDSTSIWPAAIQMTCAWKLVLPSYAFMLSFRFIYP
jgi:hypothetical protein